MLSTCFFLRIVFPLCAAPVFCLCAAVLFALAEIRLRAHPQVCRSALPLVMRPSRISRPLPSPCRDACIGVFRPRSPPRAPPFYPVHREFIYISFGEGEYLFTLPRREYGVRNQLVGKWGAPKSAGTFPRISLPADGGEARPLPPWGWHVPPLSPLLTTAQHPYSRSMAMYTLPLIHPC